MTILNISLCLPDLDVVALSQPSGQGQSIVAVTERFIVPDKSFVLLPCRHLPDSLQAESQYRPEVLSSLKEFALPSDDSIMARYWAQCVFCQRIVDEEAIAAISDRTIWTKAALFNHLKTRGKIFLSFLKVYELPEATSVDAEPVCEQLYKFVPLPNYLEVTHQGSVLSENEFAVAKQALLEPDEPSVTNPDLVTNDEGNPTLKVEVEDVLDSPDWVSKISEAGNSNDGHAFEKLVRKGLIEIGFSNSQSKVVASLNPDKTGGAGGLDFYADRPYPIVGECKATQNDKVGDPATQLHKLGIRFLEEDFDHCIKLIVAAGRVTSPANELAKKHRMNIIRPETVQRLVKSKIDFQEDFDLIQLKNCLEKPSFGEDADRKVNDYLDRCSKEWQESKAYNRLVIQVMASLKELSAQSIAYQSQDFSVLEIRAHHNAKYQPVVSTAKVDTVLEHQVYAQNSEIKRRNHDNSSFGYYLKWTS